MCVDAVYLLLLVLLVACWRYVRPFERAVLARLDKHRQRTASSTTTVVVCPLLASFQSALSSYARTQQEMFSILRKMLH